jgi:glucose/arabinose dehydrogenase
MDRSSFVRTPSRFPALRLGLLSAAVGGMLIAAIIAPACDDDEDTDTGAQATMPAETPAEGGGEATEVPEDVQLRDDNLQVETIDGVSSPTDIVFLGATDVLVSQKTGDIVRITDGEVQDEPVLQLATNHADERGVLGMTLHPQFAQNSYVYIYWTWTGEGEVPDGLFGEGTDDIEQVPDLGNRIDRFVWDGEALTFDQNIIELPSRTTDLTLDRRRGNHNGGAMKFGPDGMLYLVMGDQNERGHLQNVEDGPAPSFPDQALGIVLRMNDDGTAAEDNPFAGQDGLEYVFVYGVRNSFGFDFDPQTGAFWLQSNGEESFDQLGRYEPGDNLGWIQLMSPPERFDDYKRLESGTERQLDNPSFPPDRLADSGEDAVSRLVLFPGANYRPPMFTWLYATAPAAIGFIDGAALGEEYDGDLLVGDVNTGALYHFELTDDRMSLLLEGPLADGVNDNTEDDLIGELRDNIFGTGFLVATAIEIGPDGTLWITSIPNNAVHHITRR